MVSVTEGRPLAVVHMPARSIAPFAMSVGFITLFAALIADHLPTMAIGGAIIAASLVRWYWPQETETVAMGEVGRPGADELPLAQAGPTSNGFWGAVVFVLVLATALATAVASYFYLSGNVASASAGGPADRVAGPAIATALLAAGVVAMVVAVRETGRGRPTGTRVALVMALALVAAHLWLLLTAWSASNLRPVSSARHSAFVGVAGFQGLVATVVLVMVGVALTWAWVRPADRRGHATAWNAGVVYGFAAASGVVTFATLYLVPRLG